MLAICVYGGFFGAAAGVLMLALFLRTGSESLAARQRHQERRPRRRERRCGAGLHRVRAGPLAGRGPARRSAACSARGSGPSIVRRAPATPLRLAIAVAGLALAVKLGLDTYR